MDYLQRPFLVLGEADAELGNDDQYLSEIMSSDISPVVS